MDWITQVFRQLSEPLKWWVIVAVWEQGVRVRFGKRTKRLQPGVHLRIPFLDRVYLVATRRRIVQGRSQTTTTKDGEVITVACALQYAVEDVQLLFERVSRPEATMLALVRCAIAEVVSEHIKEDIHSELLQEAARNAMSVCEEWGLSEIEAKVTDFAFIRTYRLLQAHEHDEVRDLDYDINDKEKGR